MAKIDKKRKMVKILWETESKALYAYPSDVDGGQRVNQSLILREMVFLEISHIMVVAKIHNTIFMIYHVYFFSNN